MAFSTPPRLNAIEAIGVGVAHRTDEHAANERVQCQSNSLAVDPNLGHAWREEITLPLQFERINARMVANQLPVVFLICVVQSEHW
jgi:hypothetical protein